MKVNALHRVINESLLIMNHEAITKYKVEIEKLIKSNLF